MIIFSHPDCLGHDTGPDHPESPARLRGVLDALHAAHGDLDWRLAPLAKLGDLRRVHGQALLDAVLESADQGPRMLDPDTVAGPGSRAAALRAAGAGVAVVDVEIDHRHPLQVVGLAGVG
ncbi:MAG: histone deacetylase family protein, partial [Pseudoxanthomonas sp.]